MDNAVKLLTFLTLNDIIDLSDDLFDDQIDSPIYIDNLIHRGGLLGKKILQQAKDRISVRCIRKYDRARKCLFVFESEK